MLPGELQAKYGSDPGYKNFLSWIAQGGKAGVLTPQMMPNEAVARVVDMPWGENKAYDAAGNEISMYRQIRPGETPYYKGSGPTHLPYDEARSRSMFVPDAFKSKTSLPVALGIPNYTTPPTESGLGVSWSNPNPASLLAALAAPQEETELERQRRLAREAQLGVA